jgi:plasmid stability protein
MTGLLIKDVPKEIHDRLRSRAEAHRRSLTREALVILEEALADRSGPPTLEQIDRLRVRGAAPLTQDLIDRARQSGRP